MYYSEMARGPWYFPRFQRGRELLILMMSDGSGSGVIEIPAGGTRIPIPSEGFKEGDAIFPHGWKGRLGLLIEAFPQAVLSVLERCGKTIDEVDLIIPHQANINIIEKGMEKLGIANGEDFHKFHKYGNTAGASVPIAMHEAFEENRITEGDLVVTVAFGGGLAWGANLIQF